jgi:hypothetical protein
MSKDKKICKIEDERLRGYTKRTRAGVQIFYTGNDNRDFARHKLETHDKDGNYIYGVEMHDKPDTIRINPPEVSYYAELIAGEWWWVDGCDQCNGRERGFMGECEKHDVCVTCNKSRHEFKEPVWGGVNGWRCRPCQEALSKAEKKQALDAMPEEHHKHDYHDLDEITCPYCAFEFSDSFESASDSDEEHTCDRCDNTFKVTAIHSLTFDCERVEELAE